MKKNTENVVRKCTDFILTRKVNSACWVLFYQPELPDRLERFKKKC